MDENKYHLSQSEIKFMQAAENEKIQNIVRKYNFIIGRNAQKSLEALHYDNLIKKQYEDTNLVGRYSFYI